MLISKLFFPVLREVSADAKLKSHQIMLKAGMIRQSAAGIYSWLPLGLKVLKKIEQVVREEQNNVGVQMPAMFLGKQGNAAMQLGMIPVQGQ